MTLAHSEAAVLRGATDKTLQRRVGVISKSGDVTWMTGRDVLRGLARAASLQRTKLDRSTIEPAYVAARERDGLTVEEWETANGFPPFTVYPETRRARSTDDDGFFMYADRPGILAEEDRQMRCLRAIGLTLDSIARLFCCSLPRVQRRVDALDVRPTGRPRKDNATHREAQRRASAKYYAKKKLMRTAA